MDLEALTAEARELADRIRWWTDQPETDPDRAESLEVLREELRILRAEIYEARKARR